MRFWDGRRDAWGAVIFGVFMTVWGVYARQQSMRSRYWPTTAGVVTEWQYVDHRGRKSSATIRYRYRVQGQTYTGELISYDKFWGDEDRRSTYPEGAQVDVHYDPADPAKAVLEPGPGPGAGVKLLVGLASLAFGVWQVRTG
jgi:hypothetical protein